MDDKDRADVTAAIRTATVSSSAGTMGLIALCHELVKAGVIDQAAADRIGGFMAAAVKASDAPPRAKAALVASLAEHFVEMRAATSEEPIKH